jgi:TP901 family phage tail tape measure protein
MAKPVNIPITYKSDPSGINKGISSLNAFKAVGVAAAAAITAAFGKIAFDSAKMAMEFETSFAQIQGLVGLSKDEVIELQAAARELGPSFGKSSQEAADALFFITSAGLRGADAIDVLEASLKASAIGLGDVNAIANTATAAMNTYGASNLSGTEAVEALAEAVRLGQFAPEELASSLGQVIPISNELGISFQETTGLIAGLTKTGLPASQAVTGIKAAMQAFLKPTSEAARMLEKYGISTDEVKNSIEQDGFLATMIKLREAFGENEEDFTRVIGSIEGLNGVLALTGENVAVNQEIVSQMTDEFLIMDEAMGIVNETAQQKFNVAMENIKDSFLEIGLALIERLQPYLDRFLEWIDQNGPAIEEGFDKVFQVIDEFVSSDTMANLIQSFTDLWPEIKEAIFQFGELVSALIPFVTDALGEVLPLVQDTVSAFSDIVFFVDEAVRAIGGFSDESPGFISVLEKQLNPVQRLATAMETLAGWLNAAREAYERWRNSGFDPNEDLGGQARTAVRSRRAGGGPVTAGGAFMVGELGPEIFVPSGSGQIVPNNALGGSTINITVNAGMGTNGARVGEEIVSAIRRYERQSGPVFARA